MAQNPNDPKTCNVCHQTFNSERELQEHQKNSHSQNKPGGSQPASDPDYKEPGQDPRREKIA
jgi:hypothetical protein